MDTPSAFLVFADYYHAPDGPRTFQQVRPERLAVFSTLEEAENFVRAAASLDAPKHRNDARHGYTVRWIPSDPTPRLYEQMLLPEDESSWETLPRRDWNYNCHSVLTGSTEQIQAECDAHNALEEARLSTTPPPNPFRDRPPEFSSGDLIHLQDWCLPDTYGVVVGLSTKKGFVRHLSESQEWLGRYAVVVAVENGLMDEYVYHHDIEAYWGGERATITGVTDVPNEHKMLQLVSDYFHGNLSIPDNIVEDLVNGNIATRNVAYFPFERFEALSDPSQMETTRFHGRQDTPSERVIAVSPPIPRNVALQFGDRKGPFVVLVLDVTPPDWRTRTVRIDVAWEPIAVFSRAEGAAAFLEAVRENLAKTYGDEPENAHSFRIQLLALNEGVAAPETVSHCWCYGITGQLLWESPDPNQGQPDFEHYACEGRYQTGDIVWVVPQGLDSESESIEGDFAVVSAVPTPKEVWLDGDNDPANWSAFYTVDFVGDDYLQHYHVPESSLRPLTSPLPDALAFLAIWSNYLRGELDFPEGLADRVRAREVFLTKTPHFDFHAETVEAGMPKEYPAPRHRDFRVTHDE